MDLRQEHIDYINTVITSVVRGCDYEVALYGGNLYIFADNSVYYKIDLSPVLGFELLYGAKKFEGDVFPIEINEFNMIIQKYQEITSTINPANLLYENINVMEDPNFSELNNMKASDGAGFYYINIIDKYICIPVFAGLPLLNKSDKAYLSIYRGTLPSEFVVYYRITKKKLKTTYDIVFKVLDINRPIR